MKIKERIDNFLMQQGYTEKDIEFLNSSSEYIAQQISMFAHRSQKRINGENYFSHSYGVMQSYRNLVGIVENDYFCLDKDLLLSYSLPYDGVQEVCLLHDVLEDTEVTMEEIEEVFTQFSLGSYFRLYIKQPLSLITHDKSEDYPTYIAKLIDNPVASLVKLLDLANNMNPATLTKLGDFEFDRICKYAYFSKLINDIWHFLENANEYKQAFQHK